MSNSTDKNNLKPVPEHGRSTWALGSFTQRVTVPPGEEPEEASAVEAPPIPPSPPVNIPPAPVRLSAVDPFRVPSVLTGGTKPLPRRPLPPVKPPAQRRPLRVEHRLLPSDPATMPTIIVTDQWVVIGQRPMELSDELAPMLLAVIVSPFLSGRHLSAIVHENELLVCDLNSRNGSWFLPEGKDEYEDLAPEELKAVHCGDCIILGTPEIYYTVATCDIFHEVWHQEKDGLFASAGPLGRGGTTQPLPWVKGGGSPPLTPS